MSNYTKKAIDKYALGEYCVVELRFPFEKIEGFIVPNAPYFFAPKEAKYVLLGNGKITPIILNTIETIEFKNGFVVPKKERKNVYGRNNIKRP